LYIADKSPLICTSIRFISGASKGDFKKALGSLFKDGLVDLNPHEVTLKTLQDSTGRVHTAPTMCTLFIGNLQKQITKSHLMVFAQGILSNASPKLKVVGARVQLIDAPSRVVVRDVDEDSSGCSSDEEGQYDEQSDASESESESDGNTTQQKIPNKVNLGYGFVDVVVDDVASGDNSKIEEVSNFLSAHDILCISRELLHGKVFRGKRLAVGEADRSVSKSKFSES
jgi:hypothetical protein